MNGGRAVFRGSGEVYGCLARVICMKRGPWCDDARIPDMKESIVGEVLF